MIFRILLVVNIILFTISASSQINSDVEDYIIHNQERINYLMLLEARSDSIKADINRFFVLPDTLLYKTIQQKDRKNVKDVWAQFIDVYLTLEKLNQELNNDMEVTPHKQITEILIFVGYAISYDLGLFIIDKTINKQHYEILLDEAQPEFGIKAGQYTNLKFQIIHSNYLSLFSDEYDNIIKSLKKYDRDNQYVAQLQTYIDKKYDYIKKMRQKYGKIYFLKNTADFFTDLQQNIFMPLQKRSLKLIGDTRLTRRHGGLISEKQCDTLKTMLQTGDILFARKEWYLSNIGLPGFWPHSALYIGCVNELYNWSDDKEIFTYYQSIYPEFTDFTLYLENKYPMAWKKYIEKNSSNEYPCILEAIGEGVVWRGIYQSVGSTDYFAALRPKLSKKDIAMAIELAFSFYGRNYDYNFDFLSDYELVCSELVYKSYEKDDNKNGLNFNLEYVMGRLTLPPNSMIAQFCKDTATSNQSFVTFLDANEEEGYAFFGHYDSFKYSYLRPRWGYNEEDFLEDLREGDIDSIYSIQTKTKYFIMPLNMSVFLDKSIGNILSEGKEIINYVSLNFLSGKAARLRGVEIGLLWNYCSEYMTGAQIAVIMNTVIEDSYGFQISGLLNINASDFYGVQASGIANFVGNSMVGFQLSMLSNTCEKLYGVQAALLVNSTLDKSLGVQLGFVNISMNMKNTQIGAINTAGDISGFQFGLANGALNMKKGVQLGLINITQNNKGYPIGLFSYVNEEPPHYSVWFDEIPSMNIGVKSGREKFYNLLYYGRFLNSESSHSLGWGFGTDFKFKNIEKFSTAIGANIRHIFNSGEQFWRLNDIVQLKFDLNYNLWKKISIQLSPTFNLLLSETKPSDYINYILIDSGKRNNYYYKTWIGLGLGIIY